MPPTYDITENGETQRLDDITAIEPQNGYWVFIRGELPVRALEQKPGNSFAIVDDHDA